MLSLHAGMRVHLALGATDMRKGFDGLAAQVQTALKADPFSGHLFLFRGKRGDLLAHGALGPPEHHVDISGGGSYLSRVLASRNLFLSATPFFARSSMPRGPERRRICRGRGH